MTFDELCDGFCSKTSNYRPYKKEDVEKLLAGKGRQPANRSSLKDKIGERYLNDIPTDKLWKGIRESVEAQTRWHTKAIEIYKKLWSYYLQHYNISAAEEYRFPSVNMSNPYDTLVFMLQYLQVPHDTGERAEDVIADQLWVSSTTALNELNKIRGNDSALSILGFTIDVGLKDVHHPNRSASTCHPIFLPLNLRQVGALLLSLSELETSDLQRINNDMADLIWSQLSDYGRTRIKKIFEKRFPSEYFEKRISDKKLVFEKERRKFEEGDKEQLMAYAKKDPPLKPPLRIQYTEGSQTHILDGITKVALAEGDSYELIGDGFSMILQLKDILVL